MHKGKDRWLMPWNCVVASNYSSSSSASSLTTLKNRSSYTPLLVLTTLSQSRSCCFLRNFFVLNEGNAVSHCPFRGKWLLLHSAPHMQSSKSDTHRYLRYLPENSWCATTSIFPSPCWLMATVSPRLPTRPSTFILSWRNFSKAATSKILSEAGTEALIMNCRITSV